MAIPGLPKGSRSRVYRRIVDQLKTDPVLAAVVKTWLTWDAGRSEAMAGDGFLMAPAVMLTPRIGPVGWHAPDAQGGPLQIEVDLRIAEGFDADDPLDLWEAIEAAIYPHNARDKQLAFEQALRDLGAETGQITFSQPASIVRTAEEGGFVCVGMMQITVLRGFNP